MKSIRIENNNGWETSIYDISDVVVSGNFLIVTTKDVKENNEDDETLLIKKSTIFNLDQVRDYTITTPTRKIPNEYTN